MNEREVLDFLVLLDSDGPCVAESEREARALMGAHASATRSRRLPGWGRSGSSGLSQDSNEPSGARLNVNDAWDIPMVANERIRGDRQECWLMNNNRWRTKRLFLLACGVECRSQLQTIDESSTNQRRVG
jgi:hypothetical protein